MTLHPRQPLTAEERALAAQLPRLHGRVEPAAMLDARILAAARAAAAPPPALRPRLRWIAPMAVAASLSLAVGLAWRLQPPATLSAGAPMADAAAADMPEAQMAATADNPTQEGQAILPPPVASRSPTESPRDDVELPASGRAHQYPAAAPASAPPATPAAAAIAAVESSQAADMVSAPDVVPAPSPALAKAARATEGPREGPAVSASAAPRAQANEATQAADAAARDPQAFIGDEDVPPATVDAPEVREAWLRRIGELLQQGRSEEARASLAEFRRRYPAAPLPPELRRLEP